MLRAATERVFNNKSLYSLRTVLVILQQPHCRRLFARWLRFDLVWEVSGCSSCRLTA